MNVILNHLKQNWLIPLLFILWIFFVLATFYAAQKPFSIAQVLAIGRVVRDLLLAGWLMLVGLGLGVGLLQRFLTLNLSYGAKLIFGTGLGMGILGLIALLLGLVGLFQPLTAYIVLSALTIISFFPLKHFVVPNRSWRLVDKPSPLATIYLLLSTIFALFLALLPPTDWDGLFYHLTGPKLHIQAGQIVGGFDVPHFNFPALMEMLFAWAMLLGSDVAAKLLHFGFALLLAGLLYLAAVHLFNLKSGWPSVLILSSIQMIGFLAGWAYNDLTLAFYQLAALYAIVKWRLKTEGSNFQNPNSKPQNYHWLIMSGLFAGFAMSLKYTSFITPLFITLFILWQSYRLRPTPYALQNIIANLAIFTLPAIIIAAPWYLKSYALTGNPVYPFLYDWFGGLHWDTFRADWYASAGTGIGWRPTTLFTLPWLLTLGSRDANFWDGRTGPLLLLFLPLLIWAAFSRRFADRPPAYHYFLLYTLAHFGFWALGVIWSRSLWQSRLLLPGLVALAVVAAWLWVNMSRFDVPHFSLSRFVNIAVALVLALTLIDLGLLTLKINPLPYLIGLENREAYLIRRLGAHYGTMQQINETLPPEAKVVFLWEPRSYYCQPDCRPDSILDEFPHLVDKYGSAETIAQQWQNAGVSYVLIHRVGLNFMLTEQPERIDQSVLADLENNYLSEEFNVVGSYQVYALKLSKP